MSLENSSATNPGNSSTPCCASTSSSAMRRAFSARSCGRSDVATGSVGAQARRGAALPSLYEHAT